MSDNKELGFDILENSGINTIEDIGTEKISVDRKDMERMLKNTMKKYEKQKQGAVSRITNETNEEADSVSGVEVRERRNIPHIIYITLCSAAAVALIAGNIVMFSRHNNTAPGFNDPMAQVTSAVSGTSVTTSLSEASSTVTETGTETTSTMSSVTSEAVMTDVTVTDDTAADPDSITDWKTAYRQVLNDFMASEDFGENSTWDLQDIDNDGTPELMISEAKYRISGVFFYYYENGKAVPVLDAGNNRIECGAYGEAFICPDESLIEMSTLTGGFTYTIINKYEDHSFTFIQRTEDNVGAVGKENASYQVNNKYVSEAEYNRVCNDFSSKNWISVGCKYSFYDFSALE